MPRLVLFLLLGCVSAGVRADEVAIDSRRVQELVRELGNEIFVRRERATKELEAMGPAIIEVLREASKSSDLEISRRASELVRKADDKIQTAAFLKPKMVRLELKDAPVLQAVNQLSKISGYPIQVFGDTTAMQSRKLTLDTGETTFWQAFDRLCREGGLTEVITSAPAAAAPLLAPPARALKLPAQVLPVAPAPKVPGQLWAQLPQARGGALILPPQTTQTSNVLGVRDGTPKVYPTSYQGSLRIRAVPAGDIVGRIPAGLPEQLVVLEVTPEPRFQGVRIVGTPRTDKATDDQGQSLPALETAGPNDTFILNRVTSSTSLPRAFLRLRTGEKPAKALAELRGKLEVEGILATEAVLTVDEPLKAVGKKFDGRDGRSLSIQTLQPLANGDVQMRAIIQGPLESSSATMRVPAGAALQLAGRVQVAGNIRISTNALPTAGQMPVLLDKDGKALKLKAVGSSRMISDGITMTQDFTATYRGDEGQAPARLVVNGQRRQTVQAPFSFSNVPLQ